MITDRIKSIVPLVKMAVPIAFAIACYMHPSFLDAVLEFNLKTMLLWISGVRWP